MSFSSKKQVLSPHQYGFQINISTAHAIIDVVTSPSCDNIHRQQHTGIYFLDLKKAFETVCHQTLLTKLHHYGIRDAAHKLLSSFLERKQYVSLNHVNSELRHINYGVP